MFVPFITSSGLYRRKGGGGGGSHGSSSSGKSSSSGSSSSSGGKSSSGSSSSSSKSSPTISSGGKSVSAKSYGSGGGKTTTIPANQLFAGRTAGGGTRSQIYGSRTYGSGYPGITGAGVAGRGFPFYFWPLAWGGAAAVGTAAYLHDDEYGLPDNSSRPGGAMAAAAFVSTDNNTTFRILSDNATVVALISDITANCSSSFNTAESSTSPSSYGGYPVPEQVIQYYRASSIALTLDGYNNSAVYSSDDNATNSPLPSNTNVTLMDCLNQTIGLAAPLSDAGLQLSVPSIGILGLFYVIWNIISLF